MKSDKENIKSENIKTENIKAENLNAQDLNTEKSETDKLNTKNQKTESINEKESINVTESINEKESINVTESIHEKEESDGEPGEANVSEGSSEKPDGSRNDREENGSARSEAGESEDQEEGDDWEEDSGDDWEEETEPAKPWAITLVFLGMVGVAAVICVMLWTFTHHDRPGEQNQKTFAGTTAAPGPGGESEPGGTLGAGNQSGDPVSASNPDETDAPDADLNRVTTQDGRVIIFTDCDDMVTPKEYVNLRTEPSTAQGEATVGCRLNKGETARRTGVSEEMGWSRVEYNGQVLYVVTSIVSVVTDTQTAE